MTLQSRLLNRRSLLQGGVLALAVPYLNIMQSAVQAATNKKGKPPQRFLATYISYGVYNLMERPAFPNSMPMVRINI